MTLTTSQKERYSRHLALPEVGLAGQERLASASVLVIGAGGLGTPALTYMAAAGVGTLGVVEDDTVAASNLHRQVLFTEDDIGRPKVAAIAERLADVNRHVSVRAHPVRIHPGNARALVGKYDLVVDGSDNFATKYLVSDASVLEQVPLVYASVLRFRGEVMVFEAAGKPCYRCLYPSPPPPEDAPSCADAGVLGVLPAVIGAIQASEAIKLLLGIGDSLGGRLLRFDALGGVFRETRVNRDPACPLCGEYPSQDNVLSDYDAFCAPNRQKMLSTPEITVTELKRRLDEGEEPFLLDVRRQNEYDIANLGGELIPLNEIPERLEELEAHKDDNLVVVYCRTGARSAQAVAFLRRMGFANAVNLRGGVHAWSDEIDPSMPKY